MLGCDNLSQSALHPPVVFEALVPAALATSEPAAFSPPKAPTRKEMHHTSIMAALCIRQEYIRLVKVLLGFRHVASGVLYGVNVNGIFRQCTLADGSRASGCLGEYYCHSQTVT